VAYESRSWRCSPRAHNKDIGGAAAPAVAVAAAGLGWGCVGDKRGPDERMAALGVNVWDATKRTRVEALQWTVAKDPLTTVATVVLEWGTWARPSLSAWGDAPLGV
jgi:hypothetical protein